MKEDRARKAAHAKADAELRRDLFARQAAHKQTVLQQEVGGLLCLLLRRAVTMSFNSGGSGVGDLDQPCHRTLPKALDRGSCIRART